MWYRIREVSAWDPSMGHATGVATRGHEGRLHGEIGSLRSPREEEGRGVAGDTAKKRRTMTTARGRKDSGSRSHGSHEWGGRSPGSEKPP